MTLPPPRVLILCVAYAVLHVASHVTASWFQIDTLVLSTSLWYPPVGLALSLLVLLGPRYWPVVFVVNVSFNLIRNGDPERWQTWFFPALLCAVYVLAAWLVRKFIGSILLPGDRRSTIGFCLVVVLAPLVAGVLGAIAASRELAVLSESGFWISVLGWWIGDASGLLTVVPAAMVFVPGWLEGRVTLLPPREWRLTAIVFAVTRAAILAGSVVLVLLVPFMRDHHGFYLCFLPLVWICMTHGLPGATLATLLITMTGLVGLRLTGSTSDFAYTFLLFQTAVAGVGLGLGTLVSRRKVAEDGLAASEAQLDRVIEGAQLGLWEWDLESGRIQTNRRLAKVLGYPSERTETLDEEWAKLIHPDDLTWQQAAMATHLKGESDLYEIEYRMKAADGSWRWVHSRGSVVQKASDGSPRRVSGTHADVTDRKQAEAEIGRLLKIVESTPDFVFTTDAEGRALYANQALITWWGKSGNEGVWQGLRLEELDLGEVGRMLRVNALRAALTAGSWRGEGRLSNQTGREIPVPILVLSHHDEVRNSLTLSVILRDLTDQKRTETRRLDRQREQLQAQQNESLSVLAGGIAHDFNNLMTGVMGNASLVRTAVAEDSVEGQSIGQIEDAAARAAELCQQMLAYAGRNPVETSELDLNELAENTIKLFRPSLDQRIDVIFEGEAEPLKVLVAGTQAQQVVMNLLLNAGDAIGESEGSIKVSTRRTQLDPTVDGPRFAGQELPKGECMVLAVADSGSGMDTETLERIFEPFFTTKFTGQGLGLAAVRGFVRSHGGVMRVRSKPGEGSTFELAFPVVEAPATVPPPRKETSTHWKGEGKALIVDDDSVVMLVTTRLFQALGFTVVKAVDGVEGVEQFTAHHAELKCVILDLTMPRMDGFSAHAEMHKINPEVPVILMSGYAKKLADLPPTAIHTAGVLPKPFGIKQLRERLQKVLGN